MSDMHSEMIEQIAEERGYDRGFTAGTAHAHELLNKHLEGLKHKRVVAESEGWMRYDEDFVLQHQIKLVDDLKLLIRTGHYDENQSESGTC